MHDRRLLLWSKYPKIDPLSLIHVIVIVSFVHGWLVFCTMSCFYSIMVNVTWIFPETFVSLNKTFLIWSYNLVCSTCIFKHTIVANTMHCMALCQQDRIDKLFFRQWVMSNLRPKNNKMQWTIYFICEW